jgi:hypothetical protein
MLRKLERTIENVSVMWGSGSKYKSNAADCRELARHVTGAETKRKLELMAQAWDQLAVEQDKSDE